MKKLMMHILCGCLVIALLSGLAVAIDAAGAGITNYLSGSSSSWVSSNWSSSGGSSSGSNDSKHDINVIVEGEATVTPMSARAGKGELVSFTVTPANGYILEDAFFTYTVSWYDDEGEMYDIEYAYPKQMGNTYYFYVPNDIVNGTSIDMHFILNEPDPVLIGGTQNSPVPITDNTIFKLSGGYYTVNNDITFNSTIELDGDCVINIAKGKTLTVKPAAYGIDGNSHSLTICGEGTLDVPQGWGVVMSVNKYIQTGAIVTSKRKLSCTNAEISGGKININAEYYNDPAIKASGNITITGGEIIASTTSGSYDAIHADGSITISAGKVTASAADANHFDIYGGNGVTVTGGQVTAAAQGIGIKNNTITLGCTEDDDFITAKKYNKNVKIAQGLTLTDGTDTYKGTLTSDQISAIADKTLTGYVDQYYRISTVDDWNTFCDLLSNKNKGYFTNRTVLLENSIGTAQNPVTRIAGSSNKDFTGTFDGHGYTITFSSKENENGVAPFGYVTTDGSEENHPVIKNLNVVVDIDTEANHASALVGRAWGTLTIENCSVSGTIKSSSKYATGFIGEANCNSNIKNCRSSVKIVSSVSGDATCGGFIGRTTSSSTVTHIDGCVFDGKLLTTNSAEKCAGFVGWNSGNTSAVVISDSVYAPAALSSGEKSVIASDSAVFARNGGTFKNCYYTSALDDGVTYTGQGKMIRNITAGKNVNINSLSYTGSKTEYKNSGITAYSNGGIMLGSKLCCGVGDTLVLKLSYSGTLTQNNHVSGYTAGTTALSGYENPYTLVMPDKDVTINAVVSNMYTIVWKNRDGSVLKTDSVEYGKTPEYKGETPTYDDDFAYLFIAWDKTPAPVTDNAVYTAQYRVLTGSEAYPYIITTSGQLYKLSQLVNDGKDYEGSFFELGSDITYKHKTEWFDNTSEEKNFTPIGNFSHYFSGSFDGKGHKISGIRCYGSDYCNGLFGYIYYNSTVKNVVLADTRIAGTSNVGGIVGQSFGTVENCRVESDVVVLGVPDEDDELNEIGGVVGFNRGGSIKGCTSSATITYPEWAIAKYVGGIVGYNYYSETVVNNLALKATIPGGELQGIIAGMNVFDSSNVMTNNYYIACTVGNENNKTNYGCNEADETENNGAVSIHTVTLPENITAEPTAITIEGTEYYAAGSTVTLSAPNGYAPYNVSVSDGTDSVEVTEAENGTCTFTMPSADVKILADIDLSEEIGVRLAGNSIILGDDIGVNFFVEICPSVAHNSTAFMRFTLPNGDTKDVPVPEKADGYYAFRCEVAAKEMTDVITAQLYVDGVPVGDSFDYTVKTYADHILDDKNGFDGKTKDLVRAMLYYGACAQREFGYNIDALADADLDGYTPLDLPDEDFAVCDLSAVSAAAPEDMTLTNVSLVLESKTTLRLYFTKGSNNNLLEKAGNRQSVYEAFEKGKEVYYDITGFEAGEVFTNRTLRFDLDNAKEFDVNIGNYANWAKNGSDEALRDTIRALYSYDEYAKAYKNENYKPGEGQGGAQD